MLSIPFENGIELSTPILTDPYGVKDRIPAPPDEVADRVGSDSAWRKRRERETAAKVSKEGQRERACDVAGGRATDLFVFLFLTKLRCKRI